MCPIERHHYRWLLVTFMVTFVVCNLSVPQLGKYRAYYVSLRYVYTWIGKRTWLVNFNYLFENEGLLNVRCNFCPRDAVLARICCHRVSVCPSVCLSQSGIVPKRLHVGSRIQRCMNDNPGALSLFWCKRWLWLSTKFWFYHPNGGAKCKWGR